MTRPESWSSRGDLAALGIEIVSTGGTAKLLREAGIAVRDVSDLTGWPEMLGGRVKTLHPKVHGGILFQRGKAEDRKQAGEHSIVPIDLVVVNLYPFSATAAKPGVTAEELIENIDIGGPAMVRSAAKNFQSVGVVTDAADYAAHCRRAARASVSSSSPRGSISRARLTRAPPPTTAKSRPNSNGSRANDSVTIGKLEKLPERIHIGLERRQPMRYGENPHQAAALYIPAGRPATGLAGAKQLQGKELSYNNLVDLDAAWGLVTEFERPGVAIIKHNNPCGAAEQESAARCLSEGAGLRSRIRLWRRAGLQSRRSTRRLPKKWRRLFVECIVAPGYEPAALEKFASKKNLRLLEMPIQAAPDELELKRISGGVLVQEPDRHELSEAELKVATERAPTPEELRGAAVRLESMQST